MAPIVFLCFLCLIPTSCVALKTVTTKQLEQLVLKHEFVVAVFHSTMSEHTKEMSNRVIEEIDRVATAFTQDTTGGININRIRFVGVSLDQNMEAMTEFKLNDIPAIIVFRDRYPRTYYGQRTGYTVFSFLQELLTLEPVRIIENKQQKKLFTNEHNVHVIGYFPTQDNNPSLEAFKTAAKHYQGEIAFGIIKDASLAKTFKLKTENEIAIIKPGERPIVSTTLFDERDQMVTWIEANRKPLWGMLTFQNIYSVWQGVKTTFVVFLKNLEEHHSKTILSIFKTLSKQYGPSHDVAFVIVDAGIYKEFAQGVGLSDSDLPTFAIFHPMNRKEYFFPKEKQQISLNSAKRWLDSFLTGKLEEEEENLSEGEEFYGSGSSVTNVDSDSFQEIVLDETKDVVVEFYAPWCSHCIQLASHYKIVAQQFRLFNILLTAFDTQDNKLPSSVNITKLPTLLFYPSNDKQNPVLFSEEQYSRDARGLIQFILDYQTTLDEESIAAFKRYFTQDDEEYTTDQDDSQQQDEHEEL
eukprot:TRINITY_DN699_c0_g1_i4.p1 TRINITY_DN699_c0_g1~~TRINITY_DN699_c0_g1_i4.p1  ORF type:complete len:524 (+),score=109.37 TRINITY_DN699_c0_g1_i4:67-1638(+)